MKALTRKKKGLVTAIDCLASAILNLNNRRNFLEETIEEAETLIADNEMIIDELYATGGDEKQIETLQAENARALKVIEDAEDELMELEITFTEYKMELADCIASLEDI